MIGMVVENRLRKDLERLKTFRLLDDTFMRQAFRGQRELTQRVLRIITGIRDPVLIKDET